MRSVRISMKCARELLNLVDGVDRTALIYPAVRELKNAMKPKRSVKAAAGRRVVKRATKKEETESIYRFVNARALGACECGCGRIFIDGHLGLKREMDHAFGRGKVKQEATNCWMLTADCHRQKGRGRPDPVSWLEKFEAHCERHGYLRQADIARRKMGAARIRVVAR